MDKMKSYFKLMLVAGLIFGVCFGMGHIIGTFFMSRDKEAEPEETPAIADGERINILFMGVDARQGETQSRSDTMILASVDPKLNKAALVSIPRDTQVKIQGTTDKICAANYYGGPVLAMKEAAKLVGEDVNYYVQVDFNGFKKLVDTLGGVTVTVDQRMYKPSEGIDLKPGKQRLDGYKALAFVRNREYVTGDIERTAHQQEFLKALGRELLQPKTITKLPQLVRQTRQYVKTNISLADMLKIASWAPGFKEDSIIAQTLPGYFYDVRDSQGNLLNSFWIASESSKNGKLLDKMFNGQTVAVLAQPQSVTETAGGQTGKKNSSSQLPPKKSSTDDEEKQNWERANLPSPGHQGV
jgi:LCP family protein required for cell wall assembly